MASVYSNSLLTLAATAAWPPARPSRTACACEARLAPYPEPPAV